MVTMKSIFGSGVHNWIQICKMLGDKVRGKQIINKSSCHAVQPDDMDYFRPTAAI